MQSGRGALHFADYLRLASIFTCRIDDDETPVIHCYRAADGKYLLAAYLGQVDSFRIKNIKGRLVELGPFAAQGVTAGIDITCDSRTAYFGDAGSEIEVEVYQIASTGKLTEIENFTNDSAVNSNNVLLTADDKMLFVSNTTSVPPSITLLTVGADNKLTYVSTTTLQGNTSEARGLSATTSANKLFVAEANDNREGGEENIGVLRVRGNYADRGDEVTVFGSS